MKGRGRTCLPTSSQSKKIVEVREVASICSTAVQVQYLGTQVGTVLYTTVQRNCRCKIGKRRPGKALPQHGKAYYLGV